MSEITWSDWLDFSAEQISKIPDKPGVFMMHAAMKILHIGGSSNLRQAVSESLNNSCIKDAKRFKYSTLENYDTIKTELLREYQEKHGGKLPKCME